MLALCAALMASPLAGFESWLACLLAVSWFCGLACTGLLVGFACRLAPLAALVRTLNAGIQLIMDKKTNTVAGSVGWLPENGWVPRGIVWICRITMQAGSVSLLCELSLHRLAP